jgi:hypothetical protein
MIREGRIDEKLEKLNEARQQFKDEMLCSSKIE